MGSQACERLLANRLLKNSITKAMMSNIRIQSLAAAILSCAWRRMFESMLRATTPQKPISAAC